MNSKGILKILFPSIIGILYFSLILFSCTPRKYSGSSAINAVPPSAPIFFKINDAISLFQILGEENEWWQLLGEIKNVKQLQTSIHLIDSIINKNPEFEKFIKGKEIVLSLSPGVKDETNILTIIPLNDLGDQSLADDIIEEYIKTHQLNVTKRKFNKVPLYELTANNENEFCFTYSYCRDFLIISGNATLAEESIKQLEKSSENEDPELVPLLKTINNQAELNIFINHITGGEMLSTLLSDKMKSKVSAMKRYSAWTELDVTLKNEMIFISGFSNGDIKSNYFSNILLHQEPGTSKIESVLPSNINFFSSYYLSDINRFLDEYQNHLDNFNLFPQNQLKLKDIERKTGINLRNLFVEIFDNEIAESGLCIDPMAKNPCKILTIKTKSGSFALKKMIDFQGAFTKSEKNSSIEWERDFKIDNQTSTKFYKFPVENMPELLFGNLFANVKTSWFAVFDNYLIFADSPVALGKIYISNVLGETLISDSDYIKFQSGLTSKNNYYFFCNSAISFSVSSLFFNPLISTDISSNSEFGKFKYIAWQVSSTGNMVYNNACMFFNPNLKKNAQAVWKSHINTILARKPFIIKNRYDQQNNEIILIDSSNYVSLVNNVGRIVWQKNAGAPIISDVQMIDYNKNGDYQLIFNTKDKLFIVDKDGRDIDKFPINFREKATNGVSVFDYEDTKNYRFFVACEDRQINAYDADGELLEGWQPYKTDHIVNQPILHFSIEGKDYIVASDQMKDYIFDRKGNIRVQTDNVYQHSKNNKVYFEKRTSSHEPRLVATDSKGNIHRTYFDGSHEVVELNELDDSHFFLAANADGDTEIEYLFVQGNHIILQKNDGRNLFDQKIDVEITSLPSVFSFSANGKKIGISSSVSNKIFLFNNNGTIHPGFPLDGSSEFNIGFISDDRSNFNLLVGSPDGYLYNYLVE